MTPADLRVESVLGICDRKLAPRRHLRFAESRPPCRKSQSGVTH
jgi:hypothetical protein